MKPYLHTTFPKPLFFSYVQLRTKLQVLICLMCTSRKQPAKTKHHQQQQYLQLFIFILVNKHFLEQGQCCFPPLAYFFFLFLDIICI